MAIIKKFTALLTFFSAILLYCAPVRAEMVDTYQFANAQERTRAVELAKSLRCPQCQNQNLVESNSPIAYDLRIEVYDMVNQGKSNEQIIEAMTARFGDFVRYNPPFKATTALLWGLPFLCFLAGIVGVVYYLRRRTSTEAKNASLNQAQQQALNDLLQKTGKK
ncbi:heme lyase NrfEFG subunit NrfF [Caviibacterium pharyngocola]|nr:heme lyase NrfEFG subunit NrfF [Caviibacterium pharyngocola]